MQSISFLVHTISAKSTLTNFTFWKENATYMISQPVFNAFPILDSVPGLVWSFVKAVVLILIGLWILDRL